MAEKDTVKGVDSDEDDLALPADTLALLQEFRKTQTAQLEAFERLQAKAAADFDDIAQVDENDPLHTMEVFIEDWNLSQFWYTDLTARTLSSFILSPLVKIPLDLDSEPQVNENYDSMPDIAIAIISAPTVHQYLTRKILPRLPTEIRRKIKCVLFEHDNRFSVFGPKQYIYYDFNEPTKVPEWTKGAFSAVIIDPPFLSAECQIKTAITARLLLPLADKEERLSQKVVVCTGKKVADIVLRTYRGYGLRCTTFLPEHRNGLANEFRCFANCALKGVWEFEELK